MVADAEILVLELAATGCAAEAWVNDIPVVALRDPDIGGAYRPVNQYVGDGPNLLALRVFQHFGEVPTTIDPAWTATARLSLYRNGARPGDGSGRLLAEVSWPHPGLADRSLPATVHSEFAALPGRARRLWQYAEPLPGLSLRLPEAFGFLRTIANEFTSGAGVPLAARLARMHADFDLAYAEPSGLHAGAFVRSMELRQDTPGWVFSRLEASGFNPRVVAQGRLLDCVDQDLAPLLRGADPDGRRIALPLRIARIDGRWEVVL